MSYKNLIYWFLHVKQGKAEKVVVRVNTVKPEDVESTVSLEIVGIKIILRQDGTYTLTNK